ncbi:hypothetical protein SB2_13570 [Methylobacterium radiotolerans]|nr:hypothetical protein SB3_24315 [Methylobacterium radiotolerans]KTS47317.1 hypothetical protein SB2_13570 [Methylobacterium radiotolerans]
MRAEGDDDVRDGSRIGCEAGAQGGEIGQALGGEFDGQTFGELGLAAAQPRSWSSASKSTAMRQACRSGSAARRASKACR